MISLITALLLSLNLWAYGTSPIVDEVQLLSNQEKQSLERKIYEIHRQGGPQLAIVIKKSLDGKPIETVSYEIAQAWKLGDKKDQRGLLLLISMDERKMRIEVGSDLEGELTDVESARLIRYILAPAFKIKNYAQGLEDFIDTISQSLSKRGDKKPILQKRNGQNKLGVFLVLSVLVMLGIQAVSKKNNLARSLMSGASVSGLSLFFLGLTQILPILIIFIVASLVGLLGIGEVLYLLMQSGGAGGRYGSGGGGYGGGGGGFSGGGASGDW